MRDGVRIGGLIQVQDRGGWSGILVVLRQANRTCGGRIGETPFGSKDGGLWWLG